MQRFSSLLLMTVTRCLWLDKKREANNIPETRAYQIFSYRTPCCNRQCQDLVADVRKPAPLGNNTAFDLGVETQCSPEQHIIPVTAGRASA